MDVCGFFYEPNLSAFVIECNAGNVTSLKHLLKMPVVPEFEEGRQDRVYVMFTMERRIRSSNSATLRLNSRDVF